MSGGRVAITNGNGSDLMIDDDFIFARFQTGPQTEHKVNLGAAEKKQIDRLIENLQRLRIHAS